MIHFINIDEVANFRIRKYSEKLKHFNFSLAIFEAEKKPSLNFVFFFTREDIEAERRYKDFNSVYC